KQKLRDPETFKAVCLFAGFMCLLGILPLPMLSFYVVMRFCVTAAAIWVVGVTGSQGRILAGLVFTGIAILFNPLVPVTLPVAAFRAAAALSAAAFFASSALLLPGVASDGSRS